MALAAAWLGPLAACGGGGGGGSDAPGSAAAPIGPAATASGTRYSAVAAAGELLDLTLDPLGGRFGYTILGSLFGLGGRVVSGMLVRAVDPLFDGAFFPDGLPDSRIVTRQEGIAIGVIREILRAGTGQTVPIIGFQTPSTTLAAIAGRYNYVGVACASPARDCASASGTLTVNADGTWSICASTAANCTPAATGTLNARGEGRWQMLAGAIEVGTLVGAQFVAQRLVIVDLTDARAGGLGAGAIVGAIAQPIESREVGGLWYFNTSEGRAGFFDLNGLSALGVLAGAASGFVFGQGPFNSSLLFNQPAPGFFRGPAGGIGLIASPGVYVLNEAGRFELGLRVR